MIEESGYIAPQVSINKVLSTYFEDVIFAFITHQFLGLVVMEVEELALVLQDELIPLNGQASTQC